MQFAELTLAIGTLEKENIFKEFPHLCNYSVPDSHCRKQKQNTHNRKLLASTKGHHTKALKNISKASTSGSVIFHSSKLMGSQPYPEERP